MPNNVVFITDADSGSGQALMERFSRNGANLILNSSSNGKQLTEPIAACRANGSQPLVVNVDLCSGAEIASMLEHARHRLGPVSVLLHNHSAVQPADVETCEEDLFLNVLNANAKSAFFCTQAVGRQMAAERSGSILFIGSIHAEKPSGASFPFSASQGAVKNLAREAALFLGRFGITVNYIAMGPVEGSDALFQSEFSSLYESYRYKVPSGVLGTYGDLAELAFFLAGSGARQVNGADIRLDGGFLMHYMDHRMRKPDVPEGETR